MIKLQAYLIRVVRKPSLSGEYFSGLSVVDCIEHAKQFIPEEANAEYVLYYVGGKLTGYADYQPLYGAAPAERLL